MLVWVLISTPPGFWWLCMFLYSDCNVSPVLPPVITHLLVRPCLHGTSDLYRHLYCWSAAQIWFLSRAFSTVLPFIPIFCVSLPLLPTQATPGALPFSHCIPMPLLPQGTYVWTWRPLIWCSSCWQQTPGAPRSSSDISSSSESVHTQVHTYVYTCLRAYVNCLIITW